MKKAILISVFIGISLNLVAQVSVFTSYDKESGFSPCVTIFGQKGINEKLGFIYFGLVSEHWAEAQFGLAYSPNSWSQIGLMAGFEQAPDLFRTGGFIWLGKGNLSILTLLEKGLGGSDDYWYRVKGLYGTGNLTLGAQAWRFKGLGPLFEYRVEALDSNIWIFPSHDFEFKVSMLTFGIDISI